MRKRQKRTVGAFVKVPLDDRWHTYARMLDEPLVAFYDVRTDRELSVEEIQQRPILFRVWVMNHAVTSGRWEKVGTLPLEDDLREPPRFFKQDPLDPNDIAIYYNGHEQPATREECEGLERAAVWEPEHVEDRLRDHYAGRPNKWVESLRMK